MKITYQCVNDDGEIREIERESMIEIGSSVMIEDDLYCVIKTVDVKVFSNYFTGNCPICKKGTVTGYRGIFFRCNFCMSVVDRQGKKFNIEKYESIQQPSGYVRKRVYGPELPLDRQSKPYQVDDIEYAKFSRLSKVKKKPKLYKVGSHWI